MSSVVPLRARFVSLILEMTKPHTDKPSFPHLKILPTHVSYEMTCPFKRLHQVHDYAAPKIAHLVTTRLLISNYVTTMQEATLMPDWNDPRQRALWTLWDRCVIQRPQRNT